MALPSSSKHRAELELSSERENSKSSSSSSAREAAWPVLERVRALFAEHPARDGRTDEVRVRDFVRSATRASLVRRVGFSAEAWACCALAHALVKRELGADPCAALWWALTRAKGLSELEKCVSPNLSDLEGLLESVRSVAPKREPSRFDQDAATKPPEVKKLSFDEWVKGQKL